MRKNKKITLYILSLCATILFPAITYAATHTHNGSCYGSSSGTPHKHSGSETTYGECYTNNLSLHDCGGKIEWKSIGESKGTCPKCAKEIAIKYYSGKSSECGGSFSSTVMERCECGYKITQVDTNEKVAYPETKCKYQISKTPKFGLTCDKEDGAYYDENGNKLTLACERVVISIEPVQPEQTTNTPNFSLKATYLDGHTSFVNATGSDYDEKQAYSRAPIKLEYTGEVKSVGNQGTLTTTIILTKKSQVIEDGGIILDPGVTDTTTGSLITPSVTPNITITPIETPTPTPTPTIIIPTTSGNSGNGNSGGNGGGNDYHWGGTATNNGNGATGNGTTSYKNDAIANHTNESVKENDTPEVGTTNTTEEENIPYEYIKRNPMEIVFTTQKEVIPTSSYGVLHFSENVRNEKNDTVGTKKDPTPTPTPHSSDEYSKLEEKEEKKSNNGIYIFLIFILIGIVIAALFAWIKTRKKKDDGIEARHMNLSDRLNP